MISIVPGLSALVNTFPIPSQYLPDSYSRASVEAMKSLRPIGRIILIGAFFLLLRQIRQLLDSRRPQQGLEENAPVITSLDTWPQVTRKN